MFMSRKEFECNQLELTDNETLPAAYRLGDESVWARDNVCEMYPEIIEYFEAKGITDIRIMPCGPVDEDVLYVNGKFKGYCRQKFEWMDRSDLGPEDFRPKAKQRTK